MDYEKKYNEALSKCKAYINDTEKRWSEEFSRATEEIFKEIFPELRESEDERVRKGLIELDIDKIKREWYNKGYLEGRKNAHIPARELGLPKSWDFQQEQSECSSNLVDVDAVREDFITEVYRVLDADPTNDRANAIINAFDSLPTVSQEQPEVDLKEEIDRMWNPRFNLGWDDNSLLSINHKSFEVIARHFYELGLNARNE